MNPEIAAEVAALRVLLSEARRIGDSQTAASCLERLSWLAWVLLDGELADECARETASLEVPERSPEAFRLAVRRAADELQRGDAAQALETLDVAERQGDRLDIDAFVTYLSVRADVLCALGQDDPAIECARLSFSIAQKRPNLYARFVSALYLAYAHHAGGSLEASQATFDEAAAIAARGEFSWEAAHAQARGSYIALLRGDGPGARRRLMRSFEAAERTPWLDITRAWAGISIGLATGDETLTALFADENWIERALACRDTYSIGRILCAFHDLHRARGDEARADDLRTLALARCTADCIWPIFVSVAQHGDESQIANARTLLKAFPETHPVASAQRRLFEAALAERRGEPGAAQRAGEAYLLLDRLGYRYHATIALALAGRATEARARLREYGFAGIASRLSVKPVRGRPRLSYEAAQHRREILGLLLDGRATKEIARQLGLSERTIKSRIAEIYALTGARRRGDLSEQMHALL